jgi:hypothetical protein
MGRNLINERRRLQIARGHGFNSVCTVGMRLEKAAGQAITYLQETENSFQYCVVWGHAVA